jgi:uncharacterized protein YqeY
MSLKTQLTDDMKTAMKAGEKERLGVIRLINAAIKQKEVDERIELDDAQVLAVLEKMVKQRRDSVSQYDAAGREDLSGIERAEIAVIEHYLPAKLSEAEIEDVVDGAIRDSGATGPADMGKLMGVLKPRLAGKADMGDVSAIVKRAPVRRLSWHPPDGPHPRRFHRRPARAHRHRRGDRARVPLKRQGKEFAARCPFHDERSASFTVSPTKQFYHCFGCQRARHRDLVPDELRPPRIPRRGRRTRQARRHGSAARHAPAQRRRRHARPVRRARRRGEVLPQAPGRQRQGAAYVERRGVAPEIAERYAIGYAPDGFNALRDALGTDQRRMQLLERAGLFSKNDKGHIYDKFRDRLMFPIADRRGRTIAFGGRVLDAEDSPKYLNSPETALFHKGRELYGLWQARQVNSKLDRLIVVEGYMDVVALAQYGVSQAVATLGTATTPDHAELLFRNAADVYFCFDGDRAGRSAAWKALESVLPRMKDGRQAFFLFLPDGEDPDTIVRKEGAEGFDVRLRRRRRCRSSSIRTWRPT